MASAEIRRRGRGQRALGVATALMCALAAGAVWCVLALYTGHTLAVLALPCAGIIGWSLRDHGFTRPVAAALAVLCTALATVYAQYLLAAASVAALLGLPMRATLIDMGAGLASDVAWTSLDRIDCAIFVLALVLAAWLAGRQPRSSSSP